MTTLAAGSWSRPRRTIPELLLKALKEGHYYSSTGPEIHGVEWEDNRVHVSCSAVRSVIVQGAGSAAVHVHGPSLTRAEVPLERCANSPWLRVTVMDHAGKRAWLNPYWRD